MLNKNKIIIAFAGVGLFALAVLFIMWVMPGSSHSDQPAFPATASVIAEDFWARESLPGVEAGVAYGRIINTGHSAVRLVGAQSPVSGRVELHTHIHDEGGILRMRKVEDFIIEPGQTFYLKPAGDHLMLYERAHDLKADEVHPITLNFEGGQSLVTSFKVYPVGRIPEFVETQP